MLLAGRLWHLSESFSFPVRAVAGRCGPVMVDAWRFIVLVHHLRVTWRSATSVGISNASVDRDIVVLDRGGGGLLCYGPARQRPVLPRWRGKRLLECRRPGTLVDQPGIARPI